MAKLNLSVDVPIAPEAAWAHASNLSELGDWLSLHEAWRSELPETLTAGTEVVGIAKVKGMRNRVTWTVRTSEPPRRISLSGAGKGGTKLGLELSVAPKGDGSVFGIEVELGGRPLFGPIGSGVARSVKGDIEKSLDRFVELYS